MDEWETRLALEEIENSLFITSKCTYSRLIIWNSFFPFSLPRMHRISHKNSFSPVPVCEWRFNQSTHASCIDALQWCKSQEPKETFWFLFSSSLTFLLSPFSLFIALFARLTLVLSLLCSFLYPDQGNTRWLFHLSQDEAKLSMRYTLLSLSFSLSLVLPTPSHSSTFESLVIRTDAETKVISPGGKLQQSIHQMKCWLHTHLLSVTFFFLCYYACTKRNRDTDTHGERSKNCLSKNRGQN